MRRFVLPLAVSWLVEACSLTPQQLYDGPPRTAAETALLWAPAALIWQVNDHRINHNLKLNYSDRYIVAPGRNTISVGASEVIINRSTLYVPGDPYVNSIDTSLPQPTAAQEVSLKAGHTYYVECDKKCPVVRDMGSNIVLPSQDLTWGDKSWFSGPESEYGKAVAAARQAPVVFEP